MNERSEEIAGLYRKLGPLVFRQALKVTGNRDDASDATQQVFLKFLKSQRRFETDAEAVPFLLQATRNYCLNELRNQRKRSQALEITHSGRSEAHGDLESQISDRQLRSQVFSRVDMQSAEIATRVLVTEEEHREVASALEVSEKTVQRKLKRFVEVAKKFIARSGGE